MHRYTFYNKNVFTIKGPITGNKTVNLITNSVNNAIKLEI